MLTWKAFKEALEKEGIKDESEIEYIDWTGDELPELFGQPDFISIG